MGEGSDWLGWFSALVPALGAAAVWTIILASFATPLTTTRKAYQYGLGSAVFAYIFAIVITAVVGGLFPTASRWIAIVVIPPVVEEISRMLGVVEVRDRTDWRGWLSFGMGYGLLEAGLKLADTLVQLLSSDARGWEVAARAFLPIVPLLLHVFLSVTVFALLQKGAPLIVALIVAMGLHALHNWSAVTFIPSDWFEFLALSVLRCVGFVVLIVAAIRLSRQPVAQTEGAPG